MSKNMLEVSQPFATFSYIVRSDVFCHCQIWVRWDVCKGDLPSASASVISAMVVAQRTTALTHGELQQVGKM